jgi:hypothetical protein
MIVRSLVYKLHGETAGFQLDKQEGDAYFLHCAQSLHSPLLTLDSGMQRVAREMGITILEQTIMKVYTYCRSKTLACGCS